MRGAIVTFLVFFFNLAALQAKVTRNDSASSSTVLSLKTVNSLRKDFPKTTLWKVSTLFELRIVSKNNPLSLIVPDFLNLDQRIFTTANRAFSIYSAHKILIGPDEFYAKHAFW